MSQQETGNSYLLEKEDKVEDEVNLALSAFILAVSLFFVSENWVAMTTRQRLIMKKEPTLIKIKFKPIFSIQYIQSRQENVSRFRIFKLRSISWSCHLG